jgi:hypothetical protein
VIEPVTDERGRLMPVLSWWHSVGRHSFVRGEGGWTFLRRQPDAVVAGLAMCVRPSDVYRVDGGMSEALPFALAIRSAETGSESQTGSLEEIADWMQRVGTCVNIAAFERAGLMEITGPCSRIFDDGRNGLVTMRLLNRDVNDGMRRLAAWVQETTAADEFWSKARSCYVGVCR